MLLFSLPQAFLPVITGYLGYDAVRWDEHGLRYRRGPLALRDSLLPWDRIQAVLRVDYSPMFASRRAYIMYTANGNFLWGYNPGRTGAINTAGDGQLARLIVTKTGQPVREPVGADVMRELPVPRVPFPGSGRMTRAVAEVTLERLPAEAAERPRATQPTEREERRGRVFMRLAFVPAVVLAALYLAGFVVQVFGR